MHARFKCVISFSFFFLFLFWFALSGIRASKSVERSPINLVSHSNNGIPALCDENVFNQSARRIQLSVTFSHCSFDQSVKCGQTSKQTILLCDVSTIEDVFVRRYTNRYVGIFCYFRSFSFLF